MSDGLGIRSKLAALAAMGCLLGAAAATGATYKWVDDQGVTHYSDKLPDTASGATMQMTKSGMVFRKSEPPPTPEQIKLRAEEEAKNREAAKAAVEQKRRDDALLNSYTNEREINLVRDRNLAVVEGVIAVTRRRGDEMRQRRDELEGERVTLEEKGKSFSVTKQRELKSIDEQLPELELTIIAKTREIEALKNKYDNDVRRYRELTTRTTAKAL